MMGQKNLTEKQLINRIARIRKLGKKIVTYNGSFDVLHVGHIRSIKEAKQQGDILILLLNSDKSIRLYKGPTRPIVGEKDRAEILQSLVNVDYITFFDDINPKRILGKIKPDIHCNGSDWGKDCIEREIVEKNGGQIHVLKWTKGKSTTDLIKKIVAVNKTPIVRAVFIDRDGTVNDNKKGYIYKRDDFKFMPGVIKGLQKLSRTDYKIIIVTNQSGIGREYYSEKDFQRLMRWMVTELKKKHIRIDKIYHCPHTDEMNCSCRKPKIGMFLNAVHDFGINLDKSWLIGDDDRDVIAGREANIKVIKISTKVLRKFKLKPHYDSKNFVAAAELILNDIRNNRPK